MKKIPNPSEFCHFKSSNIEHTSVLNTDIDTNIEVLTAIAHEIEQFGATLATFKYPPYKKECLDLAPLWLFTESSVESLELFQHYTAWDEKNSTIVMKIFDYDGKTISYKRRRLSYGKWITRKSTHPNSQCINGIRSKNGPIYIIEGHHDALTGILLHHDEINSFNFFMIPTVTYTHFNEADLGFLKGRDVFFLPDLGDDDKSINGMRQLEAQVSSHEVSTRIVNMATFLQENGITAEAEKLDLSDAISLWKDSSTAFINALLYYCDRGIVFDGEVF